MTDDERRELGKVLDTLEIAARHFASEADMNAALHMASTVRPAPLATAIEIARDTIRTLLER